MSKDDEKNNDDKKDYKVGYKKPPKHTRFGQPGGNKPNTKGRPPGRNVQEFGRLSEEAIWQCFINSAQRLVTIREDSTEMTVPLISALAKRMAQDAVNGDRHARKDFLRLLENAAKGKDKQLAEIQSALANFRERRVMHKPGSLKCFEAFYDWFMTKKHLRMVEGDGPESWIYEDGEPYTEEEWAFFMERYDFLKKNPNERVAWPLKYPDDLEAERLDNMTRAERAQEHLKEFRHRREMREKEGVVKWPFLVEEPVNDRDWKLFEQHISDILEGKERPASWIPEDPDDTATVEQAEKKAQAARKKPPEAE